MRSMHPIAALLAATAVGALPLPAEAYLGPGLGLGALGAIAAIILSVILALFAVFWYPLKRLLRRRREDSGDAGRDA